jgi:gliding motility-associated-like protein
MKKLSLLAGIAMLGLSVLAPIKSLAQCGCTFNIPASQYEVNGTTLGVKPGDVICLPAGNVGNKFFKNIVGSPTNPVIVKNCGGKTFIEKPTTSSFGIDFSNSRYFRLTGTGDAAHQYGIEVKGTNQGVQIGGGSSDFELDHLHVYGTGYAGIAVKTNPSCDPATWRENYTMYNVKIHDNYVHNTTGEGYYVGNSHYHFQVDKTCGGLPIKVWEHSIVNCEVYNNISENTGRDGVQVGACITGGKVYNNKVTTTGLLDPDHINGVQINPGFVGVVYNNFVTNAAGWGIQSLGNGGTTFFNNVAENCVLGGMFVDDRGTTPGSTFNIFNNTFAKNGRYGIYFLSQLSTNNKFYNNIIISDGSTGFKYTSKHNLSSLDVQNNLQTTDINAPLFQDVAAKNYKIKPGSPATDQGRDVGAFGVSFDYENFPRPVNGKFDQGAFEIQSATITANAGADKSITLPTNTVVLTGSGYSPTGITGYIWTKKSGGAATLVNANTPTLTVNGLVQGTYVFQLQVNDAGGSAIDEATVTVLPAAVNQVPTANAGADKTITLPTNTLTLNGSGTDLDGAIVSYVWTKVSGPTAGMANANTANLALSALLQGTYEFQLTVTDDKGATGSDLVKVVVNPAATNVPPTVTVPADRILTLPTNTTVITGTATDANGTIATLLWEKRSGPTVTLANQNTLTLTASALLQGTYIFRLTATDNAGATAFDEIKVDVLPPANQSPIANAGTDKTITLPTNTINITGSGNDPDGSIANYLWSYVSGPGAPTITNGTTTTVTLSNLVAGIYTIGLTVTDNSGATGYDEVKVTVNNAAVNQTPTANAGIDKTITLPTNSVVLNGSGTDPDGTIATYLWTKKSGPIATLTNANTKDLSAGDLVAGAYVFTLRVTDNGGAFDDDDVSVTVLPAAVNLSPVANAGGNKYLTLPTSTVTLTGVGADPDGPITSYTWTQEQGPAAIMNGQTTTNLDLSGLVQGEYLFKFTVTDDKGASSSDFASVIVSSGNLPPVVDAGEDQTLVLPTNATNINGSATDPDGTVTTYLWQKVSGPSVTLNGEDSPILSLSNLIEGTYIFSLTATDEDSDDAVDEVTITVLPASTNQIPIVNAGIDQVIFLPTNSTVIQGSATDSDGTIASLLWTRISGPVVTLINDNTETLTVTGFTEGTYVFRLTATDNGGAPVFDEVKVTVNSAAANQPPIVSAGPNQIIQLPTNVATLSGSATDNDGSITTYLWTKISGPTCTLQNANTATLTVTALLEGTYIFRLTATDNGGATGIAEARVIVFPSTVNQAPVADAGQNQTLILPINSTSLVGAAFDPDGTVTTYAWTKVSGPASSSIVSPSNQVTALNSLVQGTYVFRLTVTDNGGTTGSDEVTITVNDGITNNAPVADAGGNQTINLPTNSIILFGSGSDSDGSVTSYSWTKVSGGAATLVNATSPTLTLTGLVAGVYKFRLRVTDNSGATNDDVATVLVNDIAANQPPVANAGGDIVLTLPNNSATINGNGSDNDGTIDSYLWEKNVGGTATLTNATTKNLLASNLAEGLYVMRLTVADNDGYTDFDEMNLRVLPENSNIAPTVDAGADITITSPDNTVTFNPVADDPDGTISVFFWTKVSGPTASLVDPNVKDLVVQSMVEGVYVFRITVIDDKSTSTSDLVTVTVLPAGTNQSPVVNAGADQTITLPTNSITLTGTATDPDGPAPSDLLWVKISGGTVNMPVTNTLDLALTGLAEGTYEFEFTATDNLGASSSDRVRVIVNPVPPNQPPLVDAGENVTQMLPITGSLVFNGNATDSDGDESALQYQWTLRSAPAGASPGLTGLTSTLNVTNIDKEGMYIFRLTVTDDDGDAGFDEVILVAFNDPIADRLPPLAYAGADTVLVLPDNTIEVVGDGVDPDGFIETFIWEKISGPNTPFSNPGNSLLLTDAVAGEYKFRLTVIDNDSLSAFDDMSILVTEQGGGIIIPKFFSPNNDTQNDTWAIKNVSAIDGCLVSIFTREGRKVFESTSYDNTWNGNSSSGQKLNDGDYYYVIKCDGSILASGGVRIIR